MLDGKQPQNCTHHHHHHDVGRQSTCGSGVGGGEAEAHEEKPYLTVPDITLLFASFT